MSTNEFEARVFFAIGLHTATLFKKNLINSFDTDDVMPKVLETLPDFKDFIKDSQDEVEKNVLKYYTPKLIEWYGISK